MMLSMCTIGVPPAGCAVLAYNYFDVDMIEALHGRGPAMASAIKRSLPDRVVFSYQGDGDLAAIGIAESFHAANRGEISPSYSLIMPFTE
jgi:2-oxoglutarate ferredoxin oxidoreductase subunit beta